MALPAELSRAYSDGLSMDGAPSDQQKFCTPFASASAAAEAWGVADVENSVSARGLNDRLS
jgi:hypothetical protein